MKIIVNIHLLNKKENPYNQAVKREMSIAVFIQKCRTEKMFIDIYVDIEMGRAAETMERAEWR